MKKQFQLVAFLIIVSTHLFSSCAALVVGGAAGAGSFAYFQGGLESQENTSLEKGYQATLKAMKALKYTVTESSHDALKGHVVARDSEDTKIVVKLQKKSEKVTEFRIRVGMFGDEALSQQILTKLKRYI